MLIPKKVLGREWHTRKTHHFKVCKVNKSGNKWIVEATDSPGGHQESRAVNLPDVDKWVMKIWQRSGSAPGNLRILALFWCLLQRLEKQHQGSMWQQTGSSESSSALTVIIFSLHIQSFNAYWVLNILCLFLLPVFLVYILIFMLICGQLLWIMFQKWNKLGFFCVRHLIYACI